MAGLLGLSRRKAHRHEKPPNPLQNRNDFIIRYISAEMADYFIFDFLPFLERFPSVIMLFF